MGLTTLLPIRRYCEIFYRYCRVVHHYCEIAYRHCKVTYDHCEISYAHCEVTYGHYEISYAYCEVTYGHCEEGVARRSNPEKVNDVPKSVSKKHSLVWAIGLMLSVSLISAPMISPAAIYRRQEANGDVYYSDQPSPNAKRITLPGDPATPTSDSQTRVSKKGKRSLGGASTISSAASNSRATTTSSASSKGVSSTGSGSGSGSGSDSGSGSGTGSTGSETGNDSASKTVVRELTPAEKEELARRYYQTFRLTYPANQQTFHNQRLIPVRVAVQPELRAADRIQLYLNDKAHGNPSIDTNLALKILERNTYVVYAAIKDPVFGILKKTKPITIYVKFASLGPLNRQAHTQHKPEEKPDEKGLKGIIADLKKHLPWNSGKPASSKSMPWVPIFPSP